jgi:hypothetical protein
VTTKPEISKTINIAIGCVMASGMNTEIKKEVIDSLRNIEEELIKISKEREMAQVSPLQAYPEHLVNLKKNESDASVMSVEVNSCTGCPDQLGGYIGIDLASGESQTVRLVKKEISKSFDINKGRFKK